MDLSQQVGLVLLLAAIAANWPFVTNRLFVVVRRAEKSMAWRMLELIFAYFLVGGIALAMEHSAGQIYPQRWEFYATTAFLFMTLAFPGFVYRYLWRRHH